VNDLIPIQHKGLLAWFVDNPVAVNLINDSGHGRRGAVAGDDQGGIFPEMSLNYITISVPYLGASPAEVEQGVTLRVEERWRGSTGSSGSTPTVSKESAR